MDFDEFHREYQLSRASLVAGETTDLDAAQTELRALADELTGDDKKVAERLIDGLPTLLAAVQATSPSPQSPEMAEALQILREGKFDEGTREDRLAALQEARRKIWALADRAGTDSVDIRGLTRGLETTENYLEEGLPWDPPPDSRGA